MPTKTDERRDRINVRFPADEIDSLQAYADEHYEGKLSMAVRAIFREGWKLVKKSQKRV